MLFHEYLYAIHEEMCLQTHKIYCIMSVVDLNIIKKDGYYE